MLDFLGRISAYWAGLPSLYLLLFVLIMMFGVTGNETAFIYFQF